MVSRCVWPYETLDGRVVSADNELSSEGITGLGATCVDDTFAREWRQHKIPAVVSPFARGRTRTLGISKEDELDHSNPNKKTWS